MLSFAPEAAAVLAILPSPDVHLTDHGGESEEEEAEHYS